MFESFWSLFPLSFAVSAEVGIMTRNRRRRGVKAEVMTIKALQVNLNNSISVLYICFLTTSLRTLKKTKFKNSY